MTTVNVNTPRGNQYAYETYQINNTTFNKVAGNYMFAYMQQNGLWYVLYVGQTNDLSARLNNHDKLQLAIRDGATHILARVNANETARLNEEAELIAWLKPKHNVLLK